MKLQAIIEHRSMKPVRDASKGPFISSEDLERFKVFAEKAGHKMEDHPDPFRRGFVVQYDGHWMGLLWNKNWKRYTADSRLDPLVKAFKASLETRVQGTLTLKRPT
jgi:hypothetical protein